MFYVFEGLNNLASVIYDDRYIAPELVGESIELEQLPQVERDSKREALLKADKSLEKVWWEYVDINIAPPISEDTLESLKKRIELMQSAIDELLIGGIK